MTSILILFSARFLHPCVVYSYADACRTQQHNEGKWHSSFEKYTSHFIERVVCEGAGDQTERQHIDPHSIGHNHVSFLFSWAAQLGPGGPASLGHVPQSSIFSPTHLISNWLTSCLYSGYIIIWCPLFCPLFFLRHNFALIQPIHGQGYNILIFIDRMPLLFTQVHFLFWQPGRVGGQYTTYVSKPIHHPSYIDILFYYLNFISYFQLWLCGISLELMNLIFMRFISRMSDKLW